ncbi:MAG: efflux RND transporter permease subunit, partial [Hyphomicrobium sp.]
VIAISLTIVAIFAPVSFMGGVPGQYFKQFGLTVASSVLISLLVARLITPMMAAYLMKPVVEKPHVDGIIMRAYTRLLTGTLRNAWTRYGMVALGFSVLVASVWATNMLPSGFLPEEDRSRAVVSVELPPGSTLEDTQVTTDQMVKALKAIPEIDTVFVLGGTSPTGSLEVRRAALQITLVHKSKRVKKQKQIEVDIAHALSVTPDVRTWFVNERGERTLSFNLLSNDGRALGIAVGKLESALRQVPGFRSPASEAELERPEIRVTPRFDAAAKLGVSPDQISETIRVATIGDIEANLPKFNAGDRQIPIRIQLTEISRTDVKRIEQLRVTSTSGKSIPLTAVADVTFSQGPSTITRFDRQRSAKIGADLVRGLALSDGRERFLKAVEDVKLPDGVKLQASGDAEIQDEVAQGFITAMGTGLLLVLGVLILLFASVTQPITILLSLPLSFSGVVVGLLATNNAVTMPVYIGLLMLMGIVTKNAIMLVDFGVEKMKEGVARNEAIIDAGRKRARPIVMTTLAMAAGMLPSALAFGDGGEFRAPMAIAVIGGLLVSTVLSLVFVPSFFTVMDDLGNLVRWMFGGFIGPTDEPHAIDENAVPLHPRPAADVKALAAE